MRVRGAFLWFMATVLAALPARSAEVVDLTSQPPTAEALVAALRIDAATPGSLAAVAIGVPFAAGSARLTDPARQTLDILAEALASPELATQFFLVEGHTDASGSPEQNSRISFDRAVAVQDYLVEKGVDPERLATIGRGEEQGLPGLDPNDARNRRIQITSQLSDPASAEPRSVLPLLVVLAYQVHVIRPDGTHGIVDAFEGPFRGGDQVYVTFSASATGLFDVYRVSDGDEAALLATRTAFPGETLRLPTPPDVMTFTGAGTDLLVLQFYPCATERTPFLGLRQEMLDALPTCENLTQRSFQGDRTRDIAMESNDEGSSAAVMVPVEDLPMIAPAGFSVAIPLKHR